MTYPQVYLHFPGTCREALTFYRDLFGGELQLFTNDEFQIPGLPADDIAHGVLKGPVELQAADAGPEDDAVEMKGIMLTMLGTEPELLRGWWARLAEGARIVDDLQKRPWGDYDGTLVDRYGVRWLICFKGDASGADA